MPNDLAKTASELRALMAKATPGPWEVMTGSLDVWAVNERVSAYPWAYKTDRGRVNAALIVAAINALPELLPPAERAPAAKKPDCPLCGWHRSEGESHGCSHPDCEFNPYCASPLDGAAINALPALLDAADELDRVKAPDTKALRKDNNWPRQFPLKPCPFCGGSAEYGWCDEGGDNFGGQFITCRACGVSTNLRFACGDDPKPLLMEQWNSRVKEHSVGLSRTPVDDLELVARAIAAADDEDYMEDCARYDKRAHAVIVALRRNNDNDH